MSEIAEKALAYYYANRRILPWRENPAPYHVWISEIMLQQTRVDTVIPYFERFTRTFPTIADLANAPEDQLLKLWEGLGYYSRARNLQKAARIVVNEYGGELPAEKTELLKLPGIGSYTAGAIASIAFGKKETAVDGNLIRIGSRLLAYDGTISNAQGKRKMEDLWQNLLPDENSGDFNQAMMDIGATICLPNGTPLCLLCPIREHCKAFEEGDPTKYPKKELKKARRIEEKTVLILQAGDEFLFEKREDGGLLGGMLQFPMLSGHLSRLEVLEYLSDKNFYPVRIRSGAKSKHIFSHIEWRMISWEVQLSSSEKEPSSSDPIVCEEVSDFAPGNTQEKENLPLLQSHRPIEKEMIRIRGEEIDQITLPTAFRTYRRRVAEMLK